MSNAATPAAVPARELRLDHLVHVSAPSTLPATVKELEPFFTIVPGGTHADGVTSNVLIPLPSGIYIELITFNISPPPATHEWGPKHPGPIDFALFGEPLDGQRAEVARLAEAQKAGPEFAYRQPVAGGRVRPDGKKLEVQGRGALPFFCGDVSPREWRVPELPAPHPSKALGVESITILVAPPRFASLAGYLAALLGKPVVSTESSASFALEHFAPAAEGPGPQVLIRVPESDDETAYLAAQGDFAQYEYAFHTARDGGREGVVESAVGRFAFKRLA